MSCNCQNSASGGTSDVAQFPCPCDDFVFPSPLDIGAGLTDLPRQIAGFPEFRRDMLYAIRSKAPLAGWHATKPDDMGLMLLEMWAYVCDVVAFYDKVIADELYIGTASQRPSLRKLVALLGYLPTPAVASSAKLAAIASGRQPLVVPAGTAFRSAAFNGNPPQVFELGINTTIDPAGNSWNIVPPHPGIVVTAAPASLLLKPVMVPNPGDIVFLRDAALGAYNLALQVSGTTPVSAGPGNNYTQINFTTPTTLPAKKSLGDLSLLVAKNKVDITAEPVNGSPTTIQLASVVKQIRVNDPVLILGTDDLRWFTVSSVQQQTINGPQGSVTVTIGTGSAATTATLATPGAPSNVTWLGLDAAINQPSRSNPGLNNGSPPDWTDPIGSQLILYYNFQPAGTVTDLPATTLADTDPLVLAGNVIPPVAGMPGEFLVQDANDAGADVSAATQLTAGTAQLTLNSSSGWSPALTLPVQFFGNLLNLTRGQTVTGEILGNGDATQVNQSFKLQKAPLTYLPAPSATNNAGIADTLTVMVNGIRWREVPNFYGLGIGDPVYIVRQDDNGDSLVIFGDGVRGQRLPTGVSNVVANYRYGAGAANPPANSITQIAKALKGLQSVNNPNAPTPGADADGPDSLRSNAPKTALILGRAISIDDMEAVALAWPGVNTAQVEYGWVKGAQCPLVQVWAISNAGDGNDPTFASDLQTRLYSLADPTVIIQVCEARAVPVTLTISVDTDPNMDRTTVLNNISTALTDAATGILATGNLGIGNPFFRSQLFEAVLAVQGAVSVTNILWQGLSMAGPKDFAMTPGSGKYYLFTLSFGT